MRPRHYYFPVSHDRDGDVQIVVHPVAEIMGGGFAACQDGHSLVVLDPTLNETDRRAAMLHELIHLERGLNEYPDAPRQWIPVTKREELAVEREVAARMVPEGDLRVHLKQMASLGESVTAADIAEEFEVPERVAAQALRDLKPLRRKRRRRRRKR